MLTRAIESEVAEYITRHSDERDDRDRRVDEAVLTFYDFPAEHWTHIRTTNPIEPTFATVRLRTQKTNGFL